jgi:hypothetical protein
MIMRTTIWLGALALLLGCAEEVPPPSVQDYLDDPITLEATVVRCAANRSETRYDAECINARQAISIIEAKEERARREAFEVESDKKRQALRRTQRAAAEARRRAEELERRRKEAEYLAQFGELPPREDAESATDDGETANAPSVVIPPPDDATGQSYEEANPYEETRPVEDLPASDGGNAPVAEPASEGDLDAVREELRRRAEESGSQ